MFTPRYRVSGGVGGSGLGVPDPYGAAGGGDINPGTAESMHVTENLRRGFVGLAFRPNAYIWEVEGEREVIAPINGAHSGGGDRNFGIDPPGVRGRGRSSSRRRAEKFPDRIGLPRHARTRGIGRKWRAYDRCRG